jgi:hypothetical protein
MHDDLYWFIIADIQESRESEKGECGEQHDEEEANVDDDYVKNAECSNCEKVYIISPCMCVHYIYSLSLFFSLLTFHKNCKGQRHQQRASE